jgi:hypothetical protein
MPLLSCQTHTCLCYRGPRAQGKQTLLPGGCQLQGAFLDPSAQTPAQAQPALAKRPDSPTADSIIQSHHKESHRLSFQQTQQPFVTLAPSRALNHATTIEELLAWTHSHLESSSAAPSPNAVNFTEAKNLAMLHLPRKECKNAYTISFSMR